MKRKMPHRSTKYGVGKEIGGSVYFHKQYLALFPEFIRQYIDRVPKYCNIVKFTPKSNKVSFIYSHDFDCSPEPQVNECYIVNSDGDIRKHNLPKDNPYIYHHKWLFVLDDYPGFNVNESKERSCKWLSLDNIDFSRIGKKDYWENNVINLLEEKI